MLASAPSSGGHLLPAGEKSAAARPATSSPRRGEGGERSEPGEGASSSNDDLLTIVRRVEALGTFLDTEDGKNLLAGTKRAANILAAEEKKGTAIAEAVDPALFREPQEKALFAKLNEAEAQAGEAIQKEDFSAAMRALSALREPVDTFFDKVLVNDEDLAVRANRLALLSRIRAATGQVADFSQDRRVSQAYRQLCGCFAEKSAATFRGVAQALCRKSAARPLTRVRFDPLSGRFARPPLPRFAGARKRGRGSWRLSSPPQGERWLAKQDGEGGLNRHSLARVPGGCLDGNIAANWYARSKCGQSHDCAGKSVKG